MYKLSRFAHVDAKQPCCPATLYSLRLQNNPLLFTVRSFCPFEIWINIHGAKYNTCIEPKCIL